MRELETDVVANAAVVAVDTRPGCLAEAQDITVPIAEGKLDRERIVEIREILLGRKAGRRGRDELTVYKCVGMAALDAAAGALAYRRARELRIGIEVDLLAA